MGLIRLLIIAVLAYLLWQGIKGLLRERRHDDNTAGGASVPSQKMVQCCQCDLYVPENEAIQHRGLAFCSRDHQQQYTPKRHDI